MNPAPKRRWFRFGLRTLFVVMTLSGCWLGYHLNWIRERHAYLGNSAAVVSRGSAAAPLSLRMLGEDGITSVTVAGWAANRNPAYARRLFPESKVFGGDEPLSSR
jgi:hypothetical protein